MSKQMTPEQSKEANELARMALANAEKFREKERAAEPVTMNLPGGKQLKVTRAEAVAYSEGYAHGKAAAMRDAEVLPTDEEIEDKLWRQEREKWSPAS